MDVEYNSDEDYQKQEGVNDQLQSAFNLKGMYPVGYVRENMGVTFGNTDLDEKQWAEHLGKHIQPIRYKKPTPIYGARHDATWTKRVDTVYNGITANNKEGGIVGWKKTIVNELAAASGAYGSGPSHYLEPLFYFSKKKKPVGIGQSQCHICKKVFETNTILYRHFDDVHSFNGIG